MKKVQLVSLASALLLTLPQSAAAFSFTFQWGNLKPCTSGRPNTVTNPVFSLSDVPAGTKYIRFKLKDKDAPGYNHGGGVVAFNGQSAVKPGAFKYKSPCPPNGVHTYIWTATAQKKKNGGKIGSASASRKYPE
ncbi:MAG: phospholipid-binding protein [Rhodobacteraceae bacterium]|nr:phospholipid-binding protein [Paracoccaceae bacterium]